MTGTVIRGSKNIFTVRIDEGTEYECRLKGKILKDAKGFYNPLAPGDRVLLEEDLGNTGKALIHGLEKRRNAFTRFNQKGKAPQLLASNLDMVFCVVTPDSPPFRPRFLDRALLQADIAGIPSVIVLNKCDLDPEDPDIDERLEDFIHIGYKVLRVSALTGEGFNELGRLLSGSFSAFVGQSGVGKSSIINRFAPDLHLKVGDLCEKYDRGSHTTTMAQMVEFKTTYGLVRLVDTPGVRRLMPEGIESKDLALYMREFAALHGACTYGFSCSHEKEPGCKIMEAVAAGVIHEDRYESFLRIRHELSGLYT